MKTELISGFSKLPQSKKIAKISGQFPELPNLDEKLAKFKSIDGQINQVIENFSENVISAFHLPFSIAPNFRINDQLYHIPMVIEESSVVAAASWAAKFWHAHGGFRTKVLSMTKNGQVHFTWKGDPKKLENAWKTIKPKIVKSLKPILANMEKRGGGLISLDLLNKTNSIAEYYQVDLKLDTRDSMGANLINTCLEEISKQLQIEIVKQPDFAENEKHVQVIMSILSNYTPECLVECQVETDFSAFENMEESLTGEQFARKFEMAVHIANTEIHRAVTHNKGIFNGIDAVLLATGNDFRAVEAGAHAFAAKNGNYRGLTDILIKNNTFQYTLTLPLALGTVGGVTSLHPLSKLSLQLLGNPSAEELMQIVASAGLANNFSAIKSLITKGIQHGHMKMHLQNVLLSVNASYDEKLKAVNFFRDKVVSYHEVENYINTLREH